MVRFYPHETPAPDTLLFPRPSNSSPLPLPISTFKTTFLRLFSSPNMKPQNCILEDVLHSKSACVAMSSQQGRTSRVTPPARHSEDLDQANGSPSSCTAPFGRMKVLCDPPPSYLWMGRSIVDSLGIQSGNVGLNVIARAAGFNVIFSLRCNECAWK